ncbi:YdcF family protein [Gordonia hankookensis]|uniref:YdcF family protein n=1 Tax=Gordonia hankookensis TaxID=589403 RepID=A0ABR7WB18_9ACTN|nr:YdcF family protein [Gordonia hankookensis]MBD1320006.1 YdcF family protein [Gordonia hankookensis]
MTRVAKRRAAALAVIAFAGLGGVAVGAVPVVSERSVAPAATTVDPATLYNSAQQKFAAGDVPGGLDAIKQALAIIPVDPDALALQAVWSDQAGDATTRQAALSRLRGVNPALATAARNINDGVAAAAQIVPDTTPKTVAGRAAIVVLGFGLNRDGRMAPELVRRVTAAKSQAETTTTAPIVVTGGVPKAGVTEAAAMKKWLVANGVDAARITEEGASGSTVANAQNTAEILRGQGISNVILVTSPNHIRRGAADFAAAGLRTVATVTTATDLSKFASPLTREQQKGIRLEATRTAKIPATRQLGLPLPQNLPDTGPGLITEFGGQLLETLLGTGSSEAN